MVAPTGGLDLENASTRGRVVTGVRSALGDGFDGVHFDFEPVGDEDPGYLALLDEAGPVVRAPWRMLSRSAAHAKPRPGRAAAPEATERPAARSWASNG